MHHAPPRRPPQLSAMQRSGSTPSKRPPTILISWDVDGTLLTTRGDRANRLHKRAFAAAWREVHGLELDIDAVPHQACAEEGEMGAVGSLFSFSAGQPARPPTPRLLQGSTDPLILLKVLATADDPAAAADPRLEAMADAMKSFYAAHVAQAGDGLHALPGAEAVLAARAATDGVVVGLATGNLEPIGVEKIRRLGLLQYMTPSACGTTIVGGFGEAGTCGGDWGEPQHDRAALLGVAAERAAAAAGAPPVRRVHVGDTPFDILAAVAAGAEPVGVATGAHSLAELAAVAPPGTALLDSLEDLGAVLAALGLERGSAC